MSVGRKELHVGLHQRITIECRVDAKPPARLSWKHNETDVIGRVNVVVSASVGYYDTCLKHRALVVKLILAEFAE